MHTHIEEVHAFFNPSRSPREAFSQTRCTNESKLSQIITKATNRSAMRNFFATSDQYTVHSCKVKMKDLLRCRNLHFRKWFVSRKHTELLLATPLPVCYQQLCTNQPRSDSSPLDVRELLHNSLAPERGLVCCAKLQRKNSPQQLKQSNKISTKVRF